MRTTKLQSQLKGNRIYSHARSFPLARRQFSPRSSSTARVAAMARRRGAAEARPSTVWRRWRRSGLPRRRRPAAAAAPLCPLVAHLDLGGPAGHGNGRARWLLGTMVVSAASQAAAAVGLAGQVAAAGDLRRLGVWQRRAAGGHRGQSGMVSDEDGAPMDSRVGRRQGDRWWSS